MYFESTSYKWNLAVEAENNEEARKKSVELEEPIKELVCGKQRMNIQTNSWRSTLSI